jgi:hypothetical protein
LQKLYENNVPDITGVFNHLLAEGLEAEGYVNGMPEAVVRAQINNMCQGSYGHDLWRRIHIDLSVLETRIAYQEVRKVIEDAAFELGITLHLRAGELEESKRYGYRLGKRDTKINQIRNVLGDHYSSGDESERSGTIRPRRSSQRRKSAPQTPRKRTPSGLPLTPVSMASSSSTPNLSRRNSWSQLTSNEPTSVWQEEIQEGSKIQWMPKLLFRFYYSDNFGLNTPTQLLAGVFLENSDPPPPPPPKNEALRVAAKTHLTPEKIPTPFVSFYRSIRPCLYRALVSQRDAHITIVSTTEILQNLANQFPGETGVWRTGDLCRDFDLNLRRGYNTPKEFLIYAPPGVINQAAIVATFKMSDFVAWVTATPLVANVLKLDMIRRDYYASYFTKKLKETSEPVSYESGSLIGRMLNFMGVPNQYKEIIAWKIASDWLFKGYRNAKRGNLYGDYMNGVFDVDGSVRDPSVALEESSGDDTEEGERHVGDDTVTAEAVYSPSSRKIENDHDVEQSLLDAQLQAELDSRMHVDVMMAETAVLPDSDEDDDSVIGFGRDARNKRLKSNHPSRKTPSMAKLKNSDLFVFEQSPTPAEDANQTKSNTRYTSPADTELSALDTFSKELLLKAEEVSTIGSFSHAPSTSTARGASITPGASIVGTTPSLQSPPQELVVREGRVQPTTTGTSKRRPANDQVINAERAKPMRDTTSQQRVAKSARVGQKTAKSTRTKSAKQRRAENEIEIIDLCSEEESQEMDSDVEDLGLEIVGSRVGGS